MNVLSHNFEVAASTKKPVSLLAFSQVFHLHVECERGAPRCHPSPASLALDVYKKATNFPSHSLVYVGGEGERM